MRGLLLSLPEVWHPAGADAYAAVVDFARDAAAAFLARFALENCYARVEARGCDRTLFLKCWRAAAGAVEDVRWELRCTASAFA